MPIYEYACTECGHTMEVILRHRDRQPRKCEKCSGKLKKLVSRTSFQLKGGGWFDHGYSSGSSGSGNSSGSAGSSGSSDSAGSGDSSGSSSKSSSSSDKSDSKSDKSDSKTTSGSKNS